MGATNFVCLVTDPCGYGTDSLSNGSSQTGQYSSEHRLQTGPQWGRFGGIGHASRVEGPPPFDFPPAGGLAGSPVADPRR